MLAVHVPLLDQVAVVAVAGGILLRLIWRR